MHKYWDTFFLRILVTLIAINRLNLTVTILNKQKQCDCAQYRKLREKDAVIAMLFCGGVYDFSLRRFAKIRVHIYLYVIYLLLWLVRALYFSPSLFPAPSLCLCLYLRYLIKIISVRWSNSGVHSFLRCVAHPCASKITIFIFLCPHTRVPAYISRAIVYEIYIDSIRTASEDTWVLPGLIRQTLLAISVTSVYLIKY